MMEWFNKYATILMSVWRKSDPFGNKMKTICCGSTYIFCIGQIVVGKDSHQ